jgi:hypothetical protein
MSVLIASARDLTYDRRKWEWTGLHAFLTGLDALS